MTAYTRNPSYDDYLQSTIGFDRIEHGTFDDTDKIRQLSSEHDVVINAAWSFSAEPTASIIQGLKERRQKVQKQGTLVHMSGCGNFIDGRMDGKFDVDGRVWNDDNEDDIKDIHPGMLNGAADTL